MDRKWRTNRAAIDSQLSYPDFVTRLPERDAEYTLADATELYAVYTVLHIEKKEWELRWSSSAGLYYFLAVHYPPPRDAAPVAERPEVLPGDDAEVSEGYDDPHKAMFSYKALMHVSTTGMHVIAAVERR